MDVSKLEDVLLYAISEATEIDAEAYQSKVVEMSTHYRTTIAALKRRLIGVTHLIGNTGTNLPEPVEYHHTLKFIEEVLKLPEVLHITVDRFNPLIIYTAADVNKKPVASLLCIPRKYLSGIDFSQVSYTAYSQGLFLYVMD